MDDHGSQVYKSPTEAIVRSILTYARLIAEVQASKRQKRKAKRDEPKPSGD